MPCYTVKTYNFTLEAANKALLLESLKTIKGVTGVQERNGIITGQVQNGDSFTIANGKLTLRGQAEDKQATDFRNLVARTYAHAAIAKAGKKGNFRVSRSATNPNQLTLKRS